MRKQFKVDPAILYSIITAQAGTPAKAFLELVMNSIDANATQVQLNITTSGFSVSDDGRGFNGLQEIEDFFGTFGTPHKEGDATYGRFRMGRGQIFAFSKNVWTTDTFRMSVDIKNEGLEYKLESNLEKVAGCSIAGTFYEPMSHYALEQMLRQIAEYVLYAQIPVYLNGELVSKHPSDQKWDIETEDAYIKRKASGGLAVYNLGVLVCTLSGHAYGCSGIVVSKEPLQVNFARNDVLVSQCVVWKRISKHLRQDSTEGMLKRAKTGLNEDERINLAQQLVCGEISYISVRNLPLFTDVGGRHMSVGKLVEKLIFGCKTLTVAPKGSALGDRVGQSKMALVLNSITLDRFGVPDLATLVQKLIPQIEAAGNHFSWYAEKLAKVRLIEDIEEFAPMFNMDYTVLPDKDLSPIEKCALDALSTNVHFVARLASHVSGETISCRKLHGGKSGRCNGWTDGATIVAINVKRLQTLRYGMAGAVPLCNLLVHEFLHTNSSVGSHGHDDLFFECHHDATMLDSIDAKQRGVKDIVTIARAVTARFFALCKTKKIRLPKAIYDDMDGIGEAEESMAA